MSKRFSWPAYQNSANSKKLTSWVFSESIKLNEKDNSVFERYTPDLTRAFL